jgi:tripartite-type tricarboxylate transporter receptor subunit TctC
MKDSTLQSIDRGLSRRHLLGGAAAIPLILSLSRVARAQDYPSRQLKFIVPYPAGGYK